MENQATYVSKQNEIALKQELEREVKTWVERNFNFIQLSVLEKVSDNNLFEYIIYPSEEDIFQDWLNDVLIGEKVLDYLSHNELDEADKLAKFNEYPRPSIQTIKDIFGEDFYDDFKDWCLEVQHDDIHEYIYEQENYPMWNTCFEFRDSFRNTDEDVETILSVGLGVISGLDDFNNILFMKSAGHSFYSAYWIPLYLEFYPDEKIKYSGINYQDL
jgi:hypothetical protein